MPRISFIALLVAMFATPALAQTVTLRNSPDYQKCAALTGSNPNAALAMADKWPQNASEIDGPHCRSLALFGLGRYGEAASGLDALANRVSSKQPALWATLLQQSAKAYEMAGQNDKAMNQLGQAIDQVTLANNEQLSVALLKERATLLAKQGKYFDGIQDMDHAIAISGDPNLNLTRAKIYKQMGALALARQDVDKTLSNDPSNAEAKALSADLPAAPKPKVVTKKKQTVTAKRVAVQKKLAKSAKAKKKPVAKKSSKKKKK